MVSKIIVLPLAVAVFGERHAVAVIFVLAAAGYLSYAMAVSVRAVVVSPSFCAMSVYETKRLRDNITRAGFAK